MLEVTPTGYLIHKDGVCLYCNNALLKTLKLKSHQQIIGKFAIDFVVHRQRKQILQRLQEINNSIKVNKPINYFY